MPTTLLHGETYADARTRLFQKEARDNELAHQRYLMKAQELDGLKVEALICLNNYHHTGRDYYLLRAIHVTRLALIATRYL